jgi:hypothetical protein
VPRTGYLWGVWVRPQETHGNVLRPATSFSQQPSTQRTRTTTGGPQNENHRANRRARPDVEGRLPRVAPWPPPHQRDHCAENQHRPADWCALRGPLHRRCIHPEDAPNGASHAAPVKHAGVPPHSTACIRRIRVLSALSTLCIGIQLVPPPPETRTRAQHQACWCLRPYAIWPLGPPRATRVKQVKDAGSEVCWPKRGFEPQARVSRIR